MPRAKRKSLPGIILILALVGSAAVLGVYGNKFFQSVPGGEAQTSPAEKETPTKTLPTLTESPSTESVESYPEENLNITQSSSSG